MSNIGDVYEFVDISSEEEGEIEIMTERERTSTYVQKSIKRTTGLYWKCPFLPREL